MVEISAVISAVIDNNKDAEAISTLTKRVDSLCDKFPIY